MWRVLGSPELGRCRGGTECFSQGKVLGNCILLLGTQMLTSPGAVLAKAPLVTDVVEDGSGCIEGAEVSRTWWVGVGHEMFLPALGLREIALQS